MFLSRVNTIVSLLICILALVSVGRFWKPIVEKSVGCLHVALYICWIVF